MNQDSNEPLIYETPSTTPDFKTELAAQLAELMPEVVADGKIDVVKLRELLGEDVGSDTERFGLFWPGKKRALRAAQEPTTATLRPDKANSKDWDTTQNVFIEGDNLEVLKILQKHYHNKIKLIYIDPPYNTGKDFVYPDNYKEGLETYLEWTRQVNEEGKKVSTNSESEGRYHSNWLNMMYPRLKLARNLLTDDGAIFISIDDNEVDNLKKICNEVFGEANFVAQFIWEKRVTRENRKIVSVRHDYILCYCRHYDLRELALGLSPMTEEALGRYSNPDNDPRGDWTSVPAIAQAGHGTKSQFYTLTTPSGRTVDPPSGSCWRYTKDRMNLAIADNRIWFGSDGSGVPRIKKFINEGRQGLTPETLWTSEFAGTNDLAKRELVQLFRGIAVFDTPKPVQLLKQCLLIATNPSDTQDTFCLDLFSGTSTLAHAVMQLNAEDSGRRKFIMVQLPEPTSEDSEARRAGFNAISEISRTRIKLAGEKIREESGLTAQNVDFGFRAFSLSDTGFSKWQVASGADRGSVEQRLLELRDSATDEVTPDDLLTELLLKQGYSLSEKIAESEVAGLDVRIVGDNLVIAYLTESVKPTLDQLRALVDQDPQRIIMLEDAFHGDDELKTNLAQLCKSKGIELWTA